MNPAESRLPSITVMTCRDPHVIFELLGTAALGNRRRLPPGIACVEDVQAVLRGGMAFFVARGTLARGVGGRDHPVGVIGYRWERGALRIIHVAVLESHQRSGVARRLVNAVEAIAFALGSTNVTLTVAVEYDHHRVFERFGYQPTAKLTESSHRVPMSKSLIRAPGRTA